jgi:hypothetical protein
MIRDLISPVVQRRVKFRGSILFPGVIYAEEDAHLVEPIL